jgi:DNA invertase Pin-like site-specific DNA recombinase
VVRVYRDEGISGAASSRPGLDQMLGDDQAGGFDVLMVWKIDRLGRSLSHLLTVLDRLAAHGVGFASLRDAGVEPPHPRIPTTT